MQHGLYLGLPSRNPLDAWLRRPRLELALTESGLLLASGLHKIQALFYALWPQLNKEL